MTRSVPVSQLGSEFDDFLFASIGDDGNGMLLSVLSALARLDIDPRQEAADLAQMPVGTALKRLTSLIAALPDVPKARRDPGTIAARLIALLPRWVGSSGAPHDTGAAARPRAIVRLVVINLIFMAFILSAQWIASIHQLPAQANGSPTAPPNTAAAQMPTSSSH